MSDGIYKFNFGGVVRIIFDGQVAGMFCIGGKAVKTFDSDQFFRETQKTNKGKKITKEKLANDLGLRLLSTYFERELPGADIGKLSGWNRGDVYAISGLLETPFWMMTINAKNNQVAFYPITKNNYINYCAFFDREMLKEHPFGEPYSIAA